MRRLRDAGRGEQRLHELLVHGRGGGRDAGAHVRDRGQLEQPLNGPVLPVGAVQHREVHVGTRHHRATLERAQDAAVAGRRHQEHRAATRRFRRGRVLQPPASFVVHEHRQHVVVRRQTSGHGDRGAHADLVLAGAATEEERHRQP